MSSIDSETKRKLREMGAQPLLEAIEAQHDDHVVGMSFGERLQLVVDHAWQIGLVGTAGPASWYRHSGDPEPARV
ncbi:MULTISPECIES: hypothetical protein [unclassified Dietzia]|uniref:hypothetical protein n=1 Tax=unclassified Dietzia TaxID=2617939 RepID=UPI001F509547|nr:MULTISPECIES: hypothetical protein [unclassified Dietzia]